MIVLCISYANEWNERESFPAEATSTFYDRNVNMVLEYHKIIQNIVTLDQE